MRQTTLPKNDSSLLMLSLVLMGGLTALIIVLFAVRPVHSKVTLTPDASVLENTPAPNAAMITEGIRVFRTVCAGCHGPKATGIKGLGKPLVGSQFFNSRTDAEMLAFLQTGRPVTDPLNTTGVAMPARGGRPSLTDDDLRNVIAYIRSLNGAAETCSGQDKC